MAALECIRRIVIDRLESCGLKRHDLQTTGHVSNNNGNGTTAPPSIPILHSTNLHSSRRNILFFGESMQDLGIFAYRVIGQEGINKGSAVDFANAVLHPKTPLLTNDVHSVEPVNASTDENKTLTAEENSNVGLIIANCGQLLWHPPTAKIMTQRSWHAQKRESAVHEAPSINTEINRVPGQENVEAHVKAVFGFLSQEPVKWPFAEQKINIIAVGDGATAVTEFLNKNWDIWRHHVATIAIGDGYTWDRPYLTWNQDFQKFFASVSLTHFPLIILAHPTYSSSSKPPITLFPSH